MCTVVVFDQYGLKMEIENVCTASVAVVVVTVVVGTAVHSKLTQTGVSAGHWLPSAPPQMGSPVVGVGAGVVASTVVAGAVVVVALLTVKLASLSLSE